MSEVKNFKYLIGTIDTDQKQMVVVEYESRSNRLLQAQLMSIQFPTSDLFKSFLSEFDSSEKVIFNYKTLTKRLPFSTFDGLFLYSELANEWYILDQNTHHTLIPILRESPDMDDFETHVCSCEMKNKSAEEKALAAKKLPTRLIFTATGFEIYCRHCHGYVPIDHVYQNRSGKAFESVCKSCYIPHFKPYKLGKNRTGHIQKQKDLS